MKLTASQVAAMLRHSDKDVTREHYLASLPKEKSDDDTTWAISVIVAFVCGAGLILILALAARNEGLRRQLDQRPATPAVVIVERTVAHE
jgi:hypothetical protein